MPCRGAGRDAAVVLGRDVADGVLLQRPGDLRSMQNRALAAFLDR
jgi:hypothetical protein